MPESSMEEALIEGYLADVSGRRLEDIPEALWGSRVSPATVYKLNEKVYHRIETRLNRALEGNFHHNYLAGMILKVVESDILNTHWTWPEYLIQRIQRPQILGRIIGLVSYPRLMFHPFHRLR